MPHLIPLRHPLTTLHAPDRLPRGVTVPCIIVASLLVWGWVYIALLMCLGWE